MFVEQVFLSTILAGVILVSDGASFRQHRSLEEAVPPARNLIPPFNRDYLPPLIPQTRRNALKRINAAESSAAIRDSHMEYLPPVNEQTLAEFMDYLPPVAPTKNMGTSDGYFYPKPKVQFDFPPADGLSARAIDQDLPNDEATPTIPSENGDTFISEAEATEPNFVPTTQPNIAVFFTDNGSLNNPALEEGLNQLSDRKARSTSRGTRVLQTTPESGPVRISTLPFHLNKQKAVKSKGSSSQRPRSGKAASS